MKDFLKHNGVLILIIAVLLALITTVVSILMGGSANPFADLTGILSTPFRTGIGAFVDWTEGIYSGIYEQESMRGELETLKREKADLERQAREGEAYRLENERLRNLLGLKEKRPDFCFEATKVTAHGSSNWSSTLTLSKGSSADIQPQDCVVDEYGNLVGIISEVGLNWSTVTTVIDVNLEMGSLIARTDEAAIIEGDFVLMGEKRLKLTYLPEDAQLLAGDTILTSGLVSGGEAAYPSGLVVGAVEEIRSDDSGMSDYAVIAPATDLDTLKQVFVITSFEIVE